MNPNDDIAPQEDNVVGYVLGELSGRELDEFERALALHPRLVAEVEDAKQIFALLPAATAVAPPPALRERVLAAALAEEALAATTVAKPRARMFPRSRQGWIPLTLAAAAAVAVFVLGTENGRLRRDLAVQGEVNSLLQQPNVVQNFAMKGEGGAFGTVLLDLDAKHGAVALHRLPAPVQGRVYRLWAQVDSKPVYCGDLSLGEDGVIRNLIPIPVESYTSPVERLYVTLELTDAPLVPSGPPLVSS